MMPTRVRPGVPRTRRPRAAAWCAALCLLALSGNTAHGQVAAAHFDLRGVRVYWRTIDALAAGTIGVDSAVAQLAAHPGYAQIQRNGGRLRVIGWCLRRRYPRTAADTTTPPPNRAEIHARACAHLRDAERLRDSLHAFESVLDGSAGRGWITQAFTAARTLVPAHAATALPQVHVLLFEDNGFGGDALALDLLRLMRSDVSATVRYLAHELHHSLVVRLPDDVDAARSDSVQRDSTGAFGASRTWLTWLSRVQLEGVASLLDKGEALRTDTLAPAAPQRAWTPTLVAHAASLAQVPAQLARIAGAATPAARDSALRASMEDGGHAMGQYMATVIDRGLGRAALVAVVGDRFAFAEAYARAAPRVRGAVALGAARLAEVTALRRAVGRDAAGPRDAGSPGTSGGVPVESPGSIPRPRSYTSRLPVGVP